MTKVESKVLHGKNVEVVGQPLESHVFRWRVIEPWNEPDGINCFTPSKSFLSWKDMENPAPETRTEKFVQDVRRWGYNAISLFIDPSTNPGAVQAFAKHLRDCGLGMIIRRDWCELEGRKSWPIEFTPEFWGKGRASRRLCPYSDATRRYWKGRVEDDYRAIGEFLGYRVSGTNYIYANGAPWMCDCETCRKHSERERTRDAIRLLAGILGNRGGTLFWETCQDDPGGQYEEVEYFQGMTGEIPENAFIVIKPYYWDYHPGYPRHPLFDHIGTDSKDRSPYITSVQLAGEYRGVHKFPWSMVEEWSRLMSDIVRTGQAGLWVMAIVEYNDWDHPLNMVNWHALSRFFREPLAAPKEVALDWAAQTFGVEAAPTVLEVLDRMTGAGRHMFEFEGLWTQLHSRYPELMYLDTRLCGPCRQSPRRKGMMGHTWPLHMYSEERQKEIKADVRTRLIFTPERITPEMKARMIAEKDEAIRLVREAVGIWEGLAGKVERRMHDKILQFLRGNIDDAILWRMGMDMYMDMKLGTLTERRIDAVLEECARLSLKGTIVDAPLEADPKRTDCAHTPSSLRFFAEQLRQEIRSPHLEEYCSRQSGVDDNTIVWAQVSEEG